MEHRLTDITGLRVRLDAKVCCCANAIVARVENEDAYELRCAECSSRGEAAGNGSRFSAEHGAGVWHLTRTDFSFRCHDQKG